jgi:hypothetical protein
MILEGQHHAAFLRLWQAALDAFDAPLEAFLFGVAREHWLDPPVLHQLIEVLRRPPPPRVDADRGTAQLVGDLDALLRVLDVLGEFVGLRLHKALVRGHAGNGQPVEEGVTLELAQVRTPRRIQWRLFGDGHLLVEDVHAGDSERGRLVHDRLDGDLLGAEMPVRVRGNGEPVAAARGGFLGRVCRGQWGGRDSGGGGQEGASGEVHGYGVRVLRAPSVGPFCRKTTTQTDASGRWRRMSDPPGTQGGNGPFPGVLTSHWQSMTRRGPEGSSGSVWDRKLKQLYQSPSSDPHPGRPGCGLARSC